MKEARDRARAASRAKEALQCLNTTMKRFRNSRKREFAKNSGNSGREENNGGKHTEPPT